MNSVKEEQSYSEVDAASTLDQFQDQSSRREEQHGTWDPYSKKVKESTTDKYKKYTKEIKKEIIETVEEKVKEEISEIKEESSEIIQDIIDSESSEVDAETLTEVDAETTTEVEGVEEKEVKESGGQSREESKIVENKKEPEPVSDNKDTFVHTTRVEVLSVSEREKSDIKEVQETEFPHSKQDKMARVEEGWSGQDPDDRMESHQVLAVRVTDFGGFDKLKVQKVELSLDLPPTHVEVRVHACGMNFADLYTRQGLMRDRTPPFTLGMECTGEVVAVGSTVDTVKVGDRVACYQNTGGLHQESVVLPAINCFPLPNDVGFEDGAALIVNFLTAYFCVVDIGNLQPGHSVLVHSCAGGVGWACTQLAHVVPDVTVYGTTSSEDKHEAARQNGVAHVLHSSTYERDLLALSPGGVNLVVDSVGGANFAVSQKLIKPLGRVVLTGASSMLTNERRLSFWSMLCLWWRTRGVSPNDLIMRSMVVAGLHLANLMKSDLPRVRAAMATIFKLYREGKIKPRIDSVWPFEKVVDATKRLQERKNIGKVLLKPIIK